MTVLAILCAVVFGVALVVGMWADDAESYGKQEIEVLGHKLGTKEAKKKSKAVGIIAGILAVVFLVAGGK